MGNPSVVRTPDRPGARIIGFVWIHGFHHAREQRARPVDRLRSFDRAVTLGGAVQGSFKKSKARHGHLHHRLGLFSCRRDFHRFTSYKYNGCEDSPVPRATIGGNNQFGLSVNRNPSYRRRVKFILRAVFTIHIGYPISFPATWSQSLPGYCCGTRMAWTGCLALDFGGQWLAGLARLGRRRGVFRAENHTSCCTLQLGFADHSQLD